jgi:hypothetical protein
VGHCWSSGGAFVPDAWLGCELWAVSAVSAAKTEPCIFTSDNARFDLGDERRLLVCNV